MPQNLPPGSLKAGTNKVADSFSQDVELAAEPFRYAVPFCIAALQITSTQTTLAFVKKNL